MSIDLRNLISRRLDAQGNEVAGGSPEHVITHYPQLGLMFDARTWKNVRNTKEAATHAASVDLLGRRGDWVVGEVRETHAIITYARRAPALDRSLFPHAPSAGLVHTATPVEDSPGCVWFVYLRNGGVDWHHGASLGLVVPVLRVPPSQ